MEHTQELDIITDDELNILSETIEPYPQDNDYSITTYIKEITIIVIIYYILSTNTARKQIGSIFSIINPNTKGNVHFAGILLYGLLLGILFAITRKFLI